ncbi:hypothetical protein [Catellatospora vulcania]|uniref:hypothetical protein n=1 Tax=Catellatospora vulcania TaxID=1460450 RepID=UPI0012D41E3F|nr:hypothetical protein [Catellatospora vulcania]
MSARPETVARLYDLMPRVYRTRDAGQLEQLIEVIAGQIDVLEESLDQFYDDQFVETAAAWAVPYLGDLIGYRPLSGPFGSPRAEVANTIAYRRRKGTAAMLEQLAFDVTGWKARAVEFFERLAATQYMNHIRPGKGGTPDLRHPAQLEWIGTAFDDYAHTAEVRRIATRAGRYNIHNVGIFLWRVEAVELTRSPLVPDTGSQRRFRFHPLGIDSRLYGAPRTEDEIAHLATQLDVPLPLTRRWLKAHQDAYYGKDRSLLVGLLGAATPGKVRFCDLSDVPGDWAHAPAPGSGEIAIDPVLGRVYFPDPVTGSVRAVANYHYGTAMRIGGGGYDRSPSAADGPVVADPDLQTALDQVKSGGAVEIEDNGRYAQTPVITTDDAKTVVLRAADRHRPLLAAAGPIELKPGKDGAVVLDGLMISGGPLVLKDTGDIAVRKVILKHCTLVPGLTRTLANEPGTPAAASLIIEHPFAVVEIDRCVTGPITAVEGATVAVRDSVVEAAAVADTALAVAALKLDESTVVGAIEAVRVDISNSIVLGTVTASRRQEGCVRFSFITEESLTPQKYRCVFQPPPDFTSLRFAEPGYAQLRATTADEIRRGADNESEMGVGNHLYAPQREANLLARLDEYLRFGLEAGIFYAS